MGAPAPPGRRKILGVIYREHLFVHPITPSAPPGRARVHFRTLFCLLGGGDLDVGVVHLVVLDCLLRATTKTKVVNFFLKCTPDKITATPVAAEPCHVDTCTPELMS